MTKIFSPLDAKAAGRHDDDDEGDERVVVLDYRLYYEVGNLSAVFKDAPVNRDFQRVIANLPNFQRPDGQHLRITIMDTGVMTAEERMRAYIYALTPSVHQKYRVRRVFGSQRHAGSSFGRGVPALVVWDEVEGFARDLLPHEKMGRIVTIYDYLVSPAAASGPRQ